VTPLAWAGFLVAGVFAVADWSARVRHDKRVEYVAKPATLAALLVVAIALDPADEGRRWWFVAALAFSLAGDVLLMLPTDRFVAGLAAFLVAHVCYVVGLWLDPPSGLAVVLAAVVVAAVVGPLAARIVAALRRAGPEQRALVGPVAAYIGVISAMVVSALASGNAAAAAGAVLFAVSDTMIAWDRFVRSFANASLAIMVTYHLGQALLVASLVV
jgi:uncharacterized membrane protein YhhN